MSVQNMTEAEKSDIILVWIWLKKADRLHPFGRKITSFFFSEKLHNSGIGTAEEDRVVHFVSVDIE